MPKSFTHEEVEAAKLRLAFLKENVDFAKFYKKLAENPYELCSELRKPREKFSRYQYKIHKLKIYGTPFFGGYAQQFGINDKFLYELQLLPALKELPPNATEDIPPVSTEDILILFNPKKNFDEVSCPELIEMLPLMFRTAGVNEIDDTIFSKSTTPKRKKVLSKPLIKAVTARIQTTKDLSNELTFIFADDKKGQQECLETLAHIVARHLLDKEEKKYVSYEKKLAVDSSKKTKKSWRNRIIDGSKRGAQLKKFTKVARREVMAKEKATVTVAKTIKDMKDYYPRIVKELHYFFSIYTPHSNRYVAAITGLFNFHPRTFCTDCPHFPIQRKPSSKRKIQNLTQKVRRGIDMCKIEKIFECLKHKTGRSNLRKVILLHTQAIK